MPLREDAGKCTPTYNDRGAWHKVTFESQRERLHPDYVDGFQDVNTDQNPSNQML